MEFVDISVDGVPAIWLPRDSVSQAGLVFRVGRADEALARSGITHLLDHLVLGELAGDDDHANGQVGPVTTTFVKQGGPDEIADFIHGVCANLHTTPTGRIAVEKSVLRAEAQSRVAGVFRPLARWRYGPSGFGLSGYDEFGLEGLSADDVEAWSRRWFTRGNVVLWFVGAAPSAGLRLALPDGVRMPPPIASSAVPRLPAYFTGPLHGVALDAVVPRSPAARIWATVATRRLRSTLRHDAGLSYTVGVTYAPRDAEYAAVTAVADADSSNHLALPGPFLDVLIDLARAGPDPAELVAARSTLNAPVDPRALAEHVAFDALVGAAGVDIAPDANVSSEDVRAVANDVLATALAMVPFGQAVGRAGFTQAPTASPNRVYGRTFRLIHRAEDRRELVVGERGVSLTDGPTANTVFYHDCAGALSYPDGARILFGPDGVTVVIEPELWTITPEWMQRIDAEIPPDRVAPQAARSDIPQPPPAPPPPVAPPVESRSRRRIRTSLLRLAIVAIVVAAGTISVIALIGRHSIFAVIGTWIPAVPAIRYLSSKL
jgi:hypothetical protein